VNFDAVSKTTVGVLLERNVTPCGMVNNYNITQGFSASYLKRKDVKNPENLVKQHGVIFQITCTSSPPL